MIRKSISKPQSQISNSELLPKSRSNYLPANNATTNLSTASILTLNLSTAATSNLLAAIPNNLSTLINSNTTPKFNLESHKTGNQQWFSSNSLLGLRSRNLDTSATQNPNSQNYLSLLVTLKDATNTNLGSNQQLTLTSNILPATVTEDKLLTAIFPFEIEEPLGVPLFNGATIEKKPITAMYTNAKIDGHSIKLILDSGSAGCRVDHAVSARIITADGATKTLIGEIDNLSIEINGITVLIKILIMEATHQNGQYMQVPAMCGHFKPNNIMSSMPLIDLEKEKTKPTWEAYQVLWTNTNHNKLPPILLWNDNPKEKQKEELIWKTDNLTWTDNKQEELLSWEWKEEKRKGKEREKKNTQVNNTYIPYTYGQQQSSTYH
ncbi:hypothetical protein G9A89_002432 [Geosiphon pyriformis]|nr:hypothetical protein G9A89_002432 [Geosiphon pyriformis]